MKAEEKSGTVLEISNLTTRFGSTQVHDRISLSMRRGEILALVGGSGSGKSTLLREILVLMRPNAGSIKVFGEEVTTMLDSEMMDLRRRMGVMFQYGALFSSLTVLENVGLPLREHTAISDDLINEIAYLKIRLVGLPADAAGKFPGQLSGGMRKRAALARALALDPELMFLDEPTSGLDPVGASSLDDLILHLQESLQLSILMVTHDLNSLWKLADRIAMLGEGMLVAVGDKETVINTDHRLIRAFFFGDRGHAATGK